MGSFGSATSASSSFRSEWSSDGGHPPPACECEEIPSPRWLPYSLRSTPSRSDRIPAERPRQGLERNPHLQRSSALHRGEYSPPKHFGREIRARAVVPVEFSNYDEELIEPISIDDGKKSFRLEKFCDGKVSYMLSARELNVEWGPDWCRTKWPSFPKSRFPEVAKTLQLLNASFRLAAEINTGDLSPCTMYAAYLVFHCDVWSFGRRRQVVASVTTGDVVSERRLCLGRAGGESWIDMAGCFVVDVGGRPRLVAATEPRERDDGWKEVELGEFYVGPGRDDGAAAETVRICLKDERGRVPLDLFTMAVEGIHVRPKEQTEEVAASAESESSH